MVLNGPRLAATIPYGPAKGLTVAALVEAIKVGDQELELQVHVGTVLLELESRDVIPALQAAIAPVFTDFTFRIRKAGS